MHNCGEAADSVNTATDNQIHSSRLSKCSGLLHWSAFPHYNKAPEMINLWSKKDYLDTFFGDPRAWLVFPVAFGPVSPHHGRRNDESKLSTCGWKQRKQRGSPSPTIPLEGIPTLPLPRDFPQALISQRFYHLPLLTLWEQAHCMGLWEPSTQTPGIT